MPPVSAPSPSSRALYEWGMQERRKREQEREREYVCGDYESGRGTIETNVDRCIEIARTSIAQGQEGSAFLVETY